ncbi:MAG: TatD family hydrolase [Clostridia bacterium]|nr:TatD family hydrolase [Clostridia bacterium]
MIIDSHCHLGDERLYGRVDDIIAGLKDEGIESVIEVGFDLQSSQTAVKLSEKYDNVFAVVGTHPHEAQNYNAECESFYRRSAGLDKVVAIGEIGLDYYYDLSPREIQKDVFAAQLDIAYEVGLPVVLHIRDAYKDALDILTAKKDKLGAGVLLHCYSSSAEMIKQFDKFDCYYALGGAITFKNAKKDDVIKAIPQDRLIVETDCPYMTPVPFRGQPNEPKFINYVVDKIADVKNLPREKIVEITNINTKRLFSKYNL